MTSRRYTRERRTIGCLTDAVAYYFNLHPDRVPFFIRPHAGWSRRLRLFFRRRGYAARWITCSRVPRRGMHIACGDSLAWKRATHVVVYRNGKLAYDPEHPSKWRNDRITHRLVVRRLP